MEGVREKKMKRMMLEEIEKNMKKVIKDIEVMMKMM